MSLTPMLMTELLVDERRRELTAAATRRRRSRVAAPATAGCTAGCAAAKRPDPAPPCLFEGERHERHSRGP